MEISLSFGFCGLICIYIFLMGPTLENLVWKLKSCEMDPLLEILMLKLLLHAYSLKLPLCCCYEEMGCHMGGWILYSYFISISILCKVREEL